jgi:hypothetical protein
MSAHLAPSWSPGPPGVARGADRDHRPACCGTSRGSDARGVRLLSPRPLTWINGIGGHLARDCEMPHRVVGGIEVACDRRDSRGVFLPRLSPSPMAGFFTDCAKSWHRLPRRPEDDERNVGIAQHDCRRPVVEHDPERDRLQPRHHHQDRGA